MDTPPLASSSSPPRGAHHGVGLNGDHVPQPSTSTSTPTTLDLAPLRLYLNQLVPLILGAQPSELESMYRDPLFESIVTKWANEPSQGSVYVVKSRIEPDEDVVEHSRDDSDAPTYSFLLAPVLSYSNSQAATLALIKHSSTLDMNLPLSTQLHCLNLFGPAASTSSSSNASALAPASEASATNVGSTVYEGLHRLVHYGVAPAFEAFVESKAIKEKQLELASGRSRRRQDDNKENDSKLGIPMTKKKFAELELSLLHLQQNVEIPDIVLSIHPTISAAIASAQAAGVRPSVDLIDASILEDSTFLNKLQSEVNSWIKEIQNVTKLSRDVASGTASQEINFWLAMEKALESIEEQLRSDPIVLTLDILKTAKRFHATVSFMSDTGLRGATEIVTKYNQLMKDFPLNELLAATDLAKVQDSLHLIFGHINKKLKLSPYPIRRALPLVEAISQDLNDQLLKVLGSQRLAYLDYAAFERSMSACSAVFHAWDEGLKEFTTVARDVTRKRNEKFIPIKINARHAALQERVGYFRQFRKQHHQLQVMVGPLGTEVGGAKRITTGATVAAEGGQERHASVLNDVDMDAEVKLAYENVKNVDVLDVSSEGTEIWVTAETSYNERVARVENQIIARLRDRLASARNANEMFRVFSKFNALFVRPKIRGAIAEYQSELIDSVKEDIRALHDKFKRSYAQSEAYHMSQLRDHPPVSGAIVWAKQIERQLLAYMKRVEDVLGKGWELYAEGTKLQAESQSFRRRLDTRPIYDAWLHDIQRRNLQITGRLFDITKSRAQGGQLQLVVNFDAQIITLFKEVRNLVWLGFSVPHTISNIAKDAKRVYPHAVSLMETLRTYSQTIAKLQANPGIAALVAEFRTNAQQQITKGMNVRWEHVVNSFDSRHALSTYLPGSTSTTSTSNEVAIGGGKHGVYVREFASVVSAFQDRTDALIDMYAELTRTIDNLATCAYDPASFAGLLESVQKTIDQLNLEGYANLDAWVAGLDTKIEAILLTRLRAVIDRWCVEFRREVDQGQSGGERVAPRKRVATSTGGVAKDGTAAATTGGAPAVEGDGLQLESVVHEIRIQNQVIYLDPPIERARQSWYSQLHRWLGVVCGLKRIQSSRYEIGLKLRSSAAQQHANYMGLLNQLTDGTLEKPFALVEDKLQEISQYVNKWLQFQSLWDLESEFVFARLGDSLASWQQLLLEIRKTRGTFDNSETQRSFGVAVIDYEQVQSKVNAKYDTWQRDILGRFGSKLGSTIKETHAAIQKARHDLEHHSIEGSSTAATVSFITYVQDVKRKVKQWGPMVEIFTQGQKTLERQRYQFPNDWLHVDQIEGEWSSFNDILARKNASIKDQLAGLQLKIVAQDQILHNRVNEIVVDWEANKPIQGSLKADAAMTAINTFETRVERLKDELDEVARAKEALDLDLVKDDRLEPVREEIRDLKAVWTALSGVWAQIAEVRETLWTSVQARKLRQLLDGLLATTRDMPSRMRQYAAFEYVQEALRALLKPNALIGDLKSEALRERHWRQLFKSLRVGATYSSSSMTLGTVWDLDLRRNEAVIKEVIVQAQGEMALEEFLKQVKETWTNYTLDLVNYQNKTRLIRGWDDLFTKCGENLNSLTAMKLSPYFKVFEEDASSWEDRLNRIHVLFDVWIDVQRQWVYLEGIFTGSADIKHLLPIESQRFNNINAEFLTVMKKVFKSPFVLDVLNIQGVQKSLERLADLLSKIQKALGEYLERERSSFPRFYFVGDEDLLEIIGNSKDIVRIGKFLKKMFAGLSSIKLDEDITRIEGMASREGEEVMFSTPIVFAQHPKINDWLTRLESEMKVSLAKLLARAYADLEAFYVAASGLDAANFLAWIDRYPAQLVVVAVQIAWTRLVESAIEGRKSLSDGPLAITLRGLDVLADTVLTELAPIQRRKCEHLITELVHERDVLRLLAAKGVSSTKDFEWLYHMRFYLDVSRENPLEQLSVQMASATFPYGFEYLGVPDRLVQTPLTDRCYLTLTQALDSRLGGSPFGPAGTGKTESVKALGVALGRFVLVFCCDETFDFQAMGRIFVGLCQVGAWGCFDEFNRLEERILSAVSQQIQSIQLGLSAGLTDPNAEVELVGRHVKLSQDTGIFITMNPGYAGRSNLPDNLKKLFRSIAMTRPDRELIAQVMLFSQGFRTAETLASKVVPFFNLCAEQLSSQPHYDFGLRALKAVLVSAGHLKRERLQAAAAAAAGGEDTTTTFAGVDIQEQEILIQSVTETIVPKLIADDVPLLTGLLADVFPGIDYVPVNLDKLKEHVLAVCAERHFVADEAWLQKVIQLYQIQNIQHGLMMVGPSATGKTSAWRVLQAALERLTGVEGVSYVIDPKAISKEALYGTLDSTTREWNDGLFTHILRKIVDDVRAESTKRHWIVFDGDVDPEWVENLNSVLDDNKLLTLPNGERLNLPPNVRIMFEVESLKYATLATVSRCGMVWFSEDAVTPSMLYRNYLNSIRAVAIDSVEDDAAVSRPSARTSGEDSSEVSSNLANQRLMADKLEPLFLDSDGLVPKALAFASRMDHIMDFTSIRAITTLFSLLNKTIRNVVEYNVQHSDFPLSPEQVESYMMKRFLLALVWSFTGDSKLDTRAALGDFLRENSGLDFPPVGPGSSLIDFDVHVGSGDWTSWQNAVPTIEIETHAVLSADVVIPTIDTARHEEVLYSWLSEHRPLMLCGPPGSGKTMTLFSALRKLPDLEVIGLNFSSATTPELILKTFEQRCEYRKTPNGIILAPAQIGRWIVLFCDEINLPTTDKYGTQKVISFMRQLVEQGGYYRTLDKAWVKLERIQFVGACNPPTDPGRVPLSHRFLRHAPLVMVDYPGETSLKQIYGTFARALLKVVPTLRAYAEPLTAAMVDFYLASQRRFTSDTQAHYVYSPRELTRWTRGIYEALRPLDSLPVEGLVRVWAHEALRLFQDRLVTEEERRWTDETIDTLALKHFPTINREEALARPILYSNWLSKHYVPVDREQLREYTKARLRVFYEEELDVPLVLFNDVLDHVLRIDRVFRQVQGHLLLIGVSGSGKTTLSRFVAWMNGLSVFQIKVHNKYSAEDFDDDLRSVLRRSGCKGEKIAFIMDESNVLDSGFLERMNTLLANAEIPGLFEGDEHAALMTACKEGAQRDGLMLDSPEELYRWFTTQVARNLHVVFTMNPPADGLASRAATSPALFNRCVLDWFGDWSDQAFFQVGMEFTNTLDLDTPSYAPPAAFPVAYRQLSLPPVHRSAIINALVYVHASMYETNRRLSRRQGRTNHVTPRHYLDFINQYVRIFNEKRDELEEQQRHLNVGLDKLRTTVVQVEELRKSLAIKRGQLEAKNAEANDKLKRMVADQQDAEQKKVASIEMQAALERQKKEIAERKSLVMGELADAEPAVEEAQSAVSNIKKQQLTEVRSMANPPEAVKLAMESVCTILGFQIDSWKTVQSIIRRDDFIASIVNFDTASSMTRQLREKMRREYLSRPTFNFETVNRASKACGPLCKWVIAQVNYSDILDKVGPLRDEVMALENRAETTKHQASAIITMIAELEARIASYKDEYALLISETQMIKTEMERVQQRVDRSITLLDSLGSEKTRWEAGSKTFEVQMSTVAGDVLLSAAFLAYAGYFDQHYRESMWSGWTSHLAEAGIEFKPELSLSEYLSTADDRLSWRAKSLPDDDLCTENAIMLKRFDRYPLIIDPSGQATNFLLNEYKDRKISVTSFLDEAFLKNLESALRFGTPLLIQDVEHLDPILNAVLNKELRRAGGRVLIRLGNQDIDFSPAFTLFLSTRDPSTEFPADLNSRVTMVNFSITRASLQAQSLNQVLRVERPETDRKRSDLLRLQGEFRARLHHLEKSLLSALNESQGNILDDDKVIETLETLKREAADVTRKVEETDAIMAEVEQVTSEYLPLAQASSSIFFILDELNLLHHFYQFSLRFYLDIFDYVLLRNPSLKGVTDPQQRLSILIGDLFLHVFKRTSRALIHSDHVVLAVLLAQVKLRNSNIAFDEYEFSFLLEGGEGAPHGSAPEARSSLLDSTQQRRLRSFGRLASFKDVREHIEANEDEWKAFFASSSPETVVPAIWPDVSPLVLSLRRILIVKCLRPERLLPAFGAFVNVVFERDMFVEATYSLENMVSTEVDAASPVCLCSVPGYDASYRVDNLVATTKSKCVSVAMGSQEGFALADQAIAAAARTGHWVLLKNVHLAPSWLSQLEKRLQSLNPNKAFRLFLTMETNPAIPVNILRQGRVLMNEPPPGIRANILESLKSISPARLSSGPAEKTRLYFLLAWFHAVVQERLRYAPLGWSKVYEFNDSDQDAALGMIDSWLSATAKGRANVDPALIPWDAIRSLMRESVYGGKIDTEFDQILLNSFVSFFFSPRAYDVNFELVPSGPSEAGLVMPDATRLDQFVSWASGLPEQEPPSYLSLPPSAEKVIAVAQGKAILARLLKMRSLDDDDETVAVDVKKTASSVSQPAWMRALRDSCAEWLELLPKTSVALANRNVDSFHDPLARFFDRECAVGRTLLAKIRNDLTMVIRVCDGELKQTNDIRSLMQDLTKGSVPSPWRRYRCRDLAAGAWIADFAQRLAQLTRIVESRGQLGSAPTSLGLLFHPHGFVTASRQAIAHATHTSLEQLSLQLDLEETGAPGAYIVEGLALIGAEWTSSRLVLNDGSTTRLAPSQIRWTKADDASAVPKRGRKVVGIPCWLDSSRSDALFTVQLDAGSTDPSALSQRGVCIVAALY